MCAGLSTSKILSEWEVLEADVAAWLHSGHLKGLVLEVYDPGKPTGADFAAQGFLLS